MVSEKIKKKVGFFTTFAAPPPLLGKRPNFYGFSPCNFPLKFETTRRMLMWKDRSMFGKIMNFFRIRQIRRTFEIHPIFQFGSP